MARSYVDTIDLVSGFIWILLIFLFVYLFYEHQIRKKFPQNLIIFFLLADSVFRCIWFFLSVHYEHAVYTLIINRIAILLQFTAVSVLMLLWLRALQITQLTYELNHHRNKLVNQKSPKPLHYDESTIREEAEKREKLRTQIAVICNALTWIAVIVTCAITDERLDELNINILSILCLLEAFVTMGIGIKTSLMLQREMAPVFVTNNRNITNDNKSKDVGYCQSMKDVCGCSSLYSLYQLFFSKTESALGLQMQRDVLKTLLHVTFVVAIFFTIRSFCFTYHSTVNA
jgi:hypothetical protein